jgi:hypothetical protein
MSSGKNKVIAVVIMAHIPDRSEGRSNELRMEPQFSTGSFRYMFRTDSVNSVPVCFLGKK